MPVVPLAGVQHTSGTGYIGVQQRPSTVVELALCSVQNKFISHSEKFNIIAGYFSYIPSGLKNGYVGLILQNREIPAFLRFLII